MKLRLLLFVFTLITNLSLSQNNSIKDSLLIKNGISKTSILSTHPFGLFFMRLNHNFKEKASVKKTISISLESGNIWGPKVNTYLPNSIAERNKMEGIVWYSRQFHLEKTNNNYDTFSIETDGVIKGLRANITFPLSKNKELSIKARTFLLTNGKAPFSLLTGDKFIESFHKNVAGGDDPFDRNRFEMDKAIFNYRDRNGNSVSLKNNDFVFGGIESSYLYYPNWTNNKNIFLNFGGHLGANLSNYNSSIDIGASAAGVKHFVISNNKDFRIGFGLNIIQKNSISFKSNNVDFGTNKYIGSLETDFEYAFTSKGNTTHSFGAFFYYQTSINKSNEFDYAVLERHPNSYNSWQRNTDHLYFDNNYWTLAYTISKKTETTFYIQQDFTVNNHPDIQTGMSIKFTL